MKKIIQEEAPNLNNFNILSLKKWHCALIGGMTHGPYFIELELITLHYNPSRLFK